VDNPNARGFYEAEALRGGWSVRQLRRQIGSQFYERTALSKDNAGMLIRGRKARPEDAITPEEELKDPFVLEFPWRPPVGAPVPRSSGLANRFR